jgi:hypothetical protein
LSIDPVRQLQGPKNHAQVIEALLAELGQLGLGLLGAPRERTRRCHRGESRPVGAVWALAAMGASAVTESLLPLVLRVSESQSVPSGWAIASSRANIDAVFEA